MAAKETVYPHGHHESVLRSHRWRTAENSAAHLLPYLQPATADALMPVSATGCSPLPVSSLPGWEIRYPVRHPVIRSAIYYSAAPIERRGIHKALAATSDR